MPSTERGTVMDLHVIIPGRAPELVARVVDGKLAIVPPKNAPQTPNAAEYAGHEKQAVL